MRCRYSCAACCGWTSHAAFRIATLDPCSALASRCPHGRAAKCSGQDNASGLFPQKEVPPVFRLPLYADSSLRYTLSGFSKCLFFPSEFRLELGNFILMLFYGHHVSVTRVLHCGQGQVSPGLKFGKGDPVLCTEFFQFVDAHALGFCDEAELAECRSFCRFLTHGDGHPGFFMRSRKETLRVVSVVFLDMKVPFPPRF